MATFLRTKRVSLPRLRALLSLTRFVHSKADSSLQAPVTPQVRPGSAAHQSNYAQSKWKKLDARQFGISNSMIPPHPYDVLKVLRGEGFDAYLVGGCVRDLVLNRIPKDYDVITTAKLQQVKKIFHRAVIVGRRFPICKVNIKGSIIEVSSFETRSRDAKDKKMDLVSFKSGVFAEKDFLLWRDAMSRDFTINSLFLDLCGNRKIIYDYSNAMADLKSLKLQTLIPAKLSFTKDCARILRGLRIAARLGLALSKETEIAVHSLGPSITNLPKDRILMEIDYMLSYGAAEPSLHLLWRFGLVKLLLPLHSAYLDKQNHAPSSRGTLMLMVSPRDYLPIWISWFRVINLLILVSVMKNPQDALVIWAFACILYQGNWKQGFSTARQHAGYQVNFAPEIPGSSDYSSQELAEKISHLASLVRESITSLCYSKNQPLSSGSGLAFISKKVGEDSGEIFKFSKDDVESYDITRVEKKINYAALRKGSLRETRFVIGKIIFETMKGGIVRESQNKEFIDDVSKEKETYDLVEREEHPMGNKEKNRNSHVSVLVANAVHESGKIHGTMEHNKLEEHKAIITKKRRGVEIQECNEEVKNKYQEELVPKKSKPSQQVEKKKKEVVPEAKPKPEQAIRTEIGEKEKYKQKLLTEKNKAHMLSRQVEEKKKEAAPEAKQKQAILTQVVKLKETCKQKLLTEKNKGSMLSQQVKKKKEAAPEVKREQAIRTQVVEEKEKYKQKVVNEKNNVHVLSRLFR